MSSSSSVHRRKGPSLDIVDKKTITVVYEGREYAVSWFAGASDEAIMRTIEVALGLPRGTPALVRDPEDGSALTISDSLPDGLTLDATVAAGAAALTPGGGGGGGGNVWNSSSRNKKGGDDGEREGYDSESGGSGSVQYDSQRSEDGFHAGNEKGGGDRKVLHDAADGSGKSGRGGSGGAAQEFRGELLKFERVNAHLANERTWLAWVRTALSVLGVALSLISITSDMETISMDATALALGVSFVLCTLFTYMTGWLRYTRVKEVLSWTGAQVKGRFGRFGLQYFTWFLGVALVLTVPIYLIAGVNVVEDAR